MCRPIESQGSLGGMGPAAAALFGYPPPPVNQPKLPQMQMRGGMPWAIEAASMISPSTMQPFTSMDMLGMTGTLPPPPPIVSFPKTVQAMPWMKAPNANVETMGYGIPEEQQRVLLEEAKPSALPEPLEMPRRNAHANEDFEAVELGELLDFSMPDDAENAEKDKEDLINLDDGFDGTEMSILYSFLVDTPDDKGADKKALNVESDDGILNLNVLANTPIESLMESLEEDFTDEELKMTPPPSATGDLKGKVPEVKSRRLCKAEGCYKRSRSNGLCISHGGGRRCSVEGCDKSSQGGNLCIRHGGGKRCSFEGCDKAAQSNFLCKAHGGGPRCQVDGCTRSSQGGGFCRSHGGGKRCMFDGCTKGTQRGDYCALHGGSRLCEVPGCMRNDRGGGLCATHGGGKRCSIDGCGKPCRRKGLCSAHLRQSEHAK